MGGEKLKLGIIVLELTNRCNLKCQYCSIEKDNIKDMSLDTINYLKKLNIETIILSGGEPFLHPQFEEIIELCCQNFKQVGITTNGTLITENFIEKILKFKNLTIQISIDGTKDIHDFFRGNGSYEVVCNNIKKLLTKKINIQTMSVLTKDNIYTIDKMVQAIKRMGVKKIAFERFTPIESGLNIVDKALEKKDLKWLSEHLMENNFFEGLVSINDPIINLNKLTQLKNTPLFLPCAGCFAGIKNFVIDPEGYLKICTRIPIKIAKIHDFSFENILKNDILKKLVLRDFEGKCKTCKNLMKCGGCRAEAYSIKKNLFAEDQACWK